MFVKVLVSCNDTTEVGLPSIGEVRLCGHGTKILAQNGKEYGKEYWSRHPADIVRKALTLYAALLSGREEMQIPFPSLPFSNFGQKPQSVSLLHLDLTKKQIEITEETAPVDAEGNIQLDATQSHILRTFSYNKELARENAEAASLENPQIGQTILHKGIFAGVWEPRDRDGKSLGKTFNVFAAPEDLTDESGKKVLLTFKDTPKRMTALRNWHGHDGGNFANDTALYRGLADGSAIGKWFIPTRELLVGTDLDGNEVQADNLYANKDKIGGFQTNGSGLDVWYWSCTEHRVNTSNVWNTRFSDGDGLWNLKDNTRLSCRPCRVEALNI